MPADNAVTRSRKRNARMVMVAYEGGWPVCVGTADEIASFWGISRASVLQYSMPSRQRGRNGRTVERTDVMAE